MYKENATAYMKWCGIVIENIIRDIEDAFLFIYGCKESGAYHERTTFSVYIYTYMRCYSLVYLENILLCDIMWRPDGKRPIFYKFLTSWMAFPSNETDTPGWTHPYLFSQVKIWDSSVPICILPYVCITVYCDLVYDIASFVFYNNMAHPYRIHIQTEP